MKNKMFLTAFILVLLLAGCNTIPGSTNNTIESTISVSGTGIASANPDLVDIQLGVDTVDKDPNKATNQNTDKMNTLLAVLEKMGIASADIQTTNYNLWVEDVYDQNNQPTDEKRYHVNNQVNIRLRDLSKIGSLIGEATKAGASNVFGITFGVAETTELEQAALDDAIDNARQKADWMARKMDKSVGSIIDVIEGGFNAPPVPYYAEKAGLGGGSEVPISQGQFSMTAQVQVVFELIP